MHPRFKSFFEFRHLFADSVCGLQRIGSRHLIDRHPNGRFSVQGTRRIFVFGSELHTGHFTQSRRLTARPRFHHDLIEIIFLDQSPQCRQRILKIEALLGGGLTNTACCDLDILFFQRINDVPCC